MQNIKVGWFKTYENCVTGSDLVNWMVKELSYKVDTAVDFYDILLEKGILYNIDGQDSFHDSETALYRFQADRTDIAANIVWPWTREFHKPLQVSAELLGKIITVFKAILQESEDGKGKSRLFFNVM